MRCSAAVAGKAGPGEQVGCRSGLGLGFCRRALGRQQRADRPLRMLLLRQCPSSAPGQTAIPCRGSSSCAARNAAAGGMLFSICRRKTVWRVADRNDIVLTEGRKTIMAGIGGRRSKRRR